jgi:hypothetical protein
MSDTTITKTEQASELKQLETTIDGHMHAFVETGRALKKIRDDELYKLQGYKQFENYCSDRWGFQRAHAYRLIDSSRVMENLSIDREAGPSVTPSNESQVRPLAKLEPEEQRQVWERAIEEAPKNKQEQPKITANLINKLVKEMVDDDLTTEIDTKPDSESETKNDTPVNIKVSSNIKDTLDTLKDKLKENGGDEIDHNQIIQKALEHLSQLIESSNIVDIFKVKKT